MPFECIECGYVSAKWLGRCPSCREWDTFENTEKYGKKGKALSQKGLIRSEPKKLTEIKSTETGRQKCGISGLDRLLGGGVVRGEVILVGGAPGIGKSTLFLQIASNISAAGKNVLYISGEESPAQIKIHAERLRVEGGNITVVSSGDLMEAETAVNEISPDAIFIDSIQAVADPESSGSPGTLNQVKRCGQILTSWAKSSMAPVFISGQITKQGNIAGPKVLEHMVDAVLYMDGIEAGQRIVSAAKNRFGSCGDFVLFNLTDSGLEEALDIVSKTEENTVIGQSGSCLRTGARFVPFELQSLVSNSYFEFPLRRTSGYSRERLLMLTAICVKHLGLKLGNMDVYLNVSGPNRVNERASDLAVVAAVLSSCRNTGISNKTVFFGEVGLNGEVRPLKDLKLRLDFAARNNFKEAVIPAKEKEISVKGLKLQRINHVKELEKVLTARRS